MKKKQTNKRTSNVQGIKKRRQILSASGRIFANRGYEGAGMREIATACETPPSALIYHFGSKENLFLETLRYHIIENTRLDNLLSPFRDADPDQPQSVSNALLATICNILRTCHGPTGRTTNLNGLIVSILNDSGMAVNREFRQYCDDAMEPVYILLMQANPALDRTDIFWWSHMFWAQILYTINGKLMLLSEINERKFTEQFLHAMAWRLTCQCCLPVGLPPPCRSDNWTVPLSGKRKLAEKEEASR